MKLPRLLLFVLWSCGLLDFIWGVPALPSGFPLYLCSLLFSPRSKKSVVCYPLSVVRKSSQRMPLQSLTQRGCYEIISLKYSQMNTIAKVSCRHYYGFRIFRYYNNKVALDIPKQL